MQIVKVAANPSGSHDFHFAKNITTVPEGWAVIPDDMEMPESFPFVSIEVDDNGVVTSMIPGIKPPAPEPEPTWQERTEAQIIYTAMMTDTLLEV